MRYLFFILAFAFTSVAQAAEPQPGDTCAMTGATIASNNSGVGHFMVCQGGSWKSIYSYNAAGNFTKLGNLSCAANEILKFNGTNWICAVDENGVNIVNTCQDGDPLAWSAAYNAPICPFHVRFAVDDELVLYASDANGNKLTALTGTTGNKDQWAYIDVTQQYILAKVTNSGGFNTGIVFEQTDGSRITIVKKNGVNYSATYSARCDTSWVTSNNWVCQMGEFLYKLY